MRTPITLASSAILVGVACSDVVVYESAPRVTSGTDGWRIEAVNRTADERIIEAWVVCAAM
jgi:hypothetical protein